MRDYTNIDKYLNKLAGDIYPQPPDEGHAQLAQKVIDYWMSRMTTCHSVLDVGCGQGFCQSLFERWDVKYDGVALGEDVIKAQENGYNVHKADFTFLSGIQDESFDLVFSRHSLEHSPMPLLTLMEWRRVSKQWLGIVLPHPDWYTYRGLNHYSVMNMDQIHNLLEIAGWSVIWEQEDQISSDPINHPDDLRNHEIWIMCEKKR